MKLLFLRRLFVVVLSVLSFSLFAQTSNNIPEYSVNYYDTRDPFADAGQAIALAKATNKRIMIKVGGQWCGWCNAMTAFIKDNPDVAKELYENFVVLKVNVSDSNENEKFMAGLPPTQGYPHIFVSSSDGKVLLSKDTLELVNEGEYSKAAWLAFIAKWQPVKKG